MVLFADVIKFRNFSPNYSACCDDWLPKLTLHLGTTPGAPECLKSWNICSETQHGSPWYVPGPPKTITLSHYPSQRLISMRAHESAQTRAHSAFPTLSFSRGELRVPEASSTASCLICLLNKTVLLPASDKGSGYISHGDKWMRHNSFT